MIHETAAKDRKVHLRFSVCINGRQTLPFHLPCCST